MNIFEFVYLFTLCFGIARVFSAQLQLLKINFDGAMVYYRLSNKYNEPYSDPHATRLYDKLKYEFVLLWFCWLGLGNGRKPEYDRELSFVVVVVYVGCLRVCVCLFLQAHKPKIHTKVI